MEKKRSKGCLRRFIQAIGIFLMIIVFILAGLVINQWVALSRTREQYQPPGKLVNVNTHQMHIHCLGTGSPTVVIDAGNSSFFVEWIPVQEKIAQFTRVCTYDRSGYGWSEPSPHPRDGSHVIEELHALLQNAGESGPYLLVGHSLGGVYLRMYAIEYPDQISGLVLVDTAHPLTVSPEYEKQIASSIGFYRVMDLLVRTGVMRILGPLGGETSIPETARKLPPEEREIYLNLLLDPKQYTTAVGEMEQLPATFEQAHEMERNKNPLNKLPLIVITAGQKAVPGSSPFDEHTVPIDEQRIVDQASLASISSQGEQWIIEESGHSVHLDAPEAIIDAVIYLINNQGGSN